MSETRDNQAEALLAILRASEEPMTAAQLGARIDAGGNRERRRRTVRELVADLRGAGHKVCAEIPGGQSGYWLARDDGEWGDYVAAKVDNGKFCFVRIAREKRAASERASGQGVLFADAKPTGCKAWD